MDTQAERYIGLDIHKAYFVAVGVNAAKEVVLRSQRVANGELEQWIVKVLRPTDAVVLEMTTNTWCFVDALAPHVHSVTVVHPPQVKLITRAQVVNRRPTMYQGSSPRVYQRWSAKVYQAGHGNLCETIGLTSQVNRRLPQENGGGCTSTTDRAKLARPARRIGQRWRAT
jgi:hypothetical protein